MLEVSVCSVSPPSIRAFSFAGSLAIHSGFLLFFLFSNPFSDPFSNLTLNPQGSSLADGHAVTLLSLQEATERPSVKKEQQVLDDLDDEDTSITVKKKPPEAPPPLADLNDEQIKDISTQNGSQAVGVSDGTTEIHPLSDYLFGLCKIIDSKKIYPTLSRRMGETGRVLLSLEVLRDGTIQEIKIKTRSQFERLDQAALETVSAFKKYSPLPDSVSGDRIVVEVPIEFLLYN